MFQAERSIAPLFLLVARSFHRARVSMSQSLPDPVVVPSEILRLLELGRQVATRAYAPYSKFNVGAVLVDREGREFLGCNVENASFGLTLCAERSAAVSAISHGSRDWKRIVIVSPTAVAPCGACRQFLIEFGLELDVWMGGLEETIPIRNATLSSLLPDAISRADLI